MNAAQRRIVAGEAAARGGVARNPVSSTTGCAAHGMKAAASVKATGGAHASAMEAATASAKASTWVEAAATGCMETTAAAVEATTTAVETATTAAAMKASASTAAAAWLRLGEAGECEACNSPREDCGKRERNLSAGNTHVVLPCRNGGREAGNATYCFRNNLGRQ